MNIATLTAKQKRLRHWEQFIETMVQDRDLRQRFENALGAFRGLLASAWESGNVSPDLDQRIRDAERVLERLDDDARLVVRRTSGMTAR